MIERKGKFPKLLFLSDGNCRELRSMGYFIPEDHDVGKINFHTLLKRWTEAQKAKLVAVILGQGGMFLTKDEAGCVTVSCNQDEESIKFCKMLAEAQEKIVVKSHNSTEKSIS